MHLHFPEYFNSLIRLTTVGKFQLCDCCAQIFKCFEVFASVYVGTGELEHIDATALGAARKLGSIVSASYPRSVHQIL